MSELLRVASGLSVPIDAVTQKIAWLGRTGSGKTFGAKRLVEQMLYADAQVVIVDPVGVWPGLRLGPKSFNVPVLGGLFGDIPLESTGGALVADLVVDHATSMVLDVSQMHDAERTRFAQAFGERFFQRKKSEPGAVHLVLEECQELLPQNPQPGEQRMIHEFQRIAKLGRNFGIGLSLISQRPQEVSKKALNQAECVFAFQMTGPQERKALEYWLSDKGFDGKLSQLLPRLAVGSPHVWSPQWLKVSKVVTILPIDSLDTSQTPKVGDAAFRQRKLEPIDLKALTVAMAETVERAKADDPKALRARVAELERQLAERDPAETERIEVLMFDRESFNELQEALTSGLSLALGNAKGALHTYMSKCLQAHSAQPGSVRGEERRSAAPAPARAATLTAIPSRATNDSGLGRCERALLTAWVQHGRLTLTQAAIIAGYSTASSTPGNAASKLRSLGYVEGSNTEGVSATAPGERALGQYDRLPTGRALADYWLSQLGKCEAAILRQVLKRYPRAVSLDQAAEAEGYSLESSTPGNAASKLRTLALVHGKNAAMVADERLVG